jgi:hypothetical protein
MGDVSSVSYPLYMQAILLSSLMDAHVGCPLILMEIRDVWYWPLLSFSGGNVAKLSVTTVLRFTLSVNHDCVLWLGLQILRLSYESSR